MLLPLLRQRPGKELDLETQSRTHCLTRSWQVITRTINNVVTFARAVLLAHLD